MFIKALKFALLSILITVACAAASNAQGTLTPEKRALIKELLDLAGGHKTSEAVVNAMLDASEKEFPRMIDSMMPSLNDLPWEEQSELRSIATSAASRIYQRYREAITGKLDFAQLIEDISYPLYDKYFTEDELRDLISFYKSSTGKKSVEVMPKLLTDSMSKFSEVAMPRLQLITEEITKEEMKRVEEETRAVVEKYQAEQKAAPQPTPQRRAARGRRAKP